MNIEAKQSKENLCLKSNIDLKIVLKLSYFKIYFLKSTVMFFLHIEFIIGLVIESQKLLIHDLMVKLMVEL